MQVISACVKLSAVKTEPKNVTYMVGTFLNENGDKLLKISALTIQLKPKKVTNTVGTFLNKNGGGFRKAFRPITELLHNS